MRRKWECTGYVCMSIWALISLGLFALGIYFVADEGNAFYKSWLLSLTISYVCGWAVSLAITVLMFMLMFRCCMTNDHKFGFVVTFQDYMNWYDVYGEESRLCLSNASDVGATASSSPQKQYNTVPQDEVELGMVNRPIDV